MSRNKTLQWIAPAAAAILVLVVVWARLGGQTAVPAEEQRAPPAEQQAAAEKALDWLRAQQKDDGSFDAGFGHPAGVTCDAALAVVASGGDPATWSPASGKPSISQYLAMSAFEYAVDPATTGKLIVTLVAAGYDAKDSGNDWVAHLQSFSDGRSAYDPGSVGQAWAILALKAAGEKLPADALSVLKSYQLETGAWPSAFAPNDTVSYALQALIAAGEPANSEAIQKALAFFQEQQNDDGGFPAIKPSEWGTDSNANSTANVIMALLAVGENPAGEKWTKDGGNPLTALLGLQADDGRIEFQPGVGEPLLSTVQAVPALLNKALPLLTRQ
jgi:squalene cyclase